MRAPRRFPRLAILAALLGTVASGCSRDDSGFTAPSLQAAGAGPTQDDFGAAIAARNRHTPVLLRVPGVIGTGVGLLPNGRPGVVVFLLNENVTGLPAAVDGVPLARRVTGRIMALSDPTKRLRPAPLGYSVGHPSITAGTFGARVVDGSGAVYLLSNNHVLAASNDASIGDPTLQPGTFDGGTAADKIGTLWAFNPIDFSFTGQNRMDAAIARSTVAEIGNATPADDGYGTPNATIANDANNDGTFDNLSGVLNLDIQKFGRTTKLTRGRITAVNATIEVCYEVLFIFCIKSAYFVDQLVIGGTGFSGGGDSGSLIVTDNAGLHPVALLFAGSETETIANRIDLVLGHFGVRIDGGGAPPPPPTPTTDLAVSSVSAPGAVTQGSTVNVVVTVQNRGTEDVGAFDVMLRDATDNVTIGTQGVTGLAAGATTTSTFSWNTASASIGPHTLIASHGLTDDNAGNNQASATSTVNFPAGAGNIHIGNLDGIASDDGTTWSAIVEITVHDANHAPLNGATVVGSWSRNGLNANTCTTGELGGVGTCIVLFPSLSKKSVKAVTFTVGSVTMAGRTYVSSNNHDVDGSSNGTSVKVSRP
ncbi:MAG: CARDB domain-containing protein [Gemmatimonadales bacterium]